MKTPIGIRNNNPLNIRYVPGTRWQGQILPLGQSPVGSGAIGESSARRRAKDRRGSFCKFSSMEWGIRAALKILQTYRDKHYATCIEEIISRWAPPSENDTQKYINDVCRITGFGGRERLSEKEWHALIKAMGLIESGILIPDETIAKAWELLETN